MAEITLRQRQTRQDRLPEVCMACGQPSVEHINKNFSWYPPWIGIFILIGVPVYVILAMVMTKRMTVEVPVCDKHRGYWWKRLLLIWLPLIAIGLIGIGTTIAMSEAGPGPNDVAGFVCLGSIVVGLVWLIVAVIIQNTMIRPAEITDTTIRLKSVNQDFVDAFNEMRDSEYDDDDDRPRRRRSNRDDDDLPRGRRASNRDDDDDRPRDKRSSFRADDDDDRPRRRRE